MVHSTTFVELTGGPWRSGPLLVARRPLVRLLGLRAVPPGCGLLMRTRSIHTFGRRDPLPAAGIGGDGVLRWARMVPPRRVVVDLRAAWIAEMPGAALPAPGLQLQAGPAGPENGGGPMLAGWPGP